MKTGHRYFKRLLPLSLYGELSPEEQARFERHLEKCPECRATLDEAQGVQGLLRRRILKTPSEEVLLEARQELRRRLREERRRAMAQRWWEKLLGFFPSPSPALRLAGSVALLGIGVLVGRFLVAPKAEVTSKGPEAVPATEQTFAVEPRITNVQVVSLDPATGQVEVHFHAQSDVLLRGTVDEEPIRRVLTYALMNEDHPGVRLKTVKALAGLGQALSRGPVDSEVMEALLYALERDNNAGVRLKAIKVLKSMPLNQRIKEVLIRVLVKDHNSAVRIEAIDALSQARDDEDVLPILQRAARDDTSAYVQYKASKALERSERPPVREQGQRNRRL